MPRAEGGGLVYFAREHATGRVVGLQLESGPRASLMMTPTQFDAIDETVHVEEPRRGPMTKTPKRISIDRAAITTSGEMSAFGALTGRNGQRSVARLSVLLAAAGIVLLLVLVVLIYRGVTG
jgi:hypothetical protein